MAVHLQAKRIRLRSLGTYVTKPTQRGGAPGVSLPIGGKGEGGLQLRERREGAAGDAVARGGIWQQDRGERETGRREGFSRVCPKSLLKESKTRDNAQRKQNKKPPNSAVISVGVGKGFNRSDEAEGSRSRDQARYHWTPGGRDGKGQGPYLSGVIGRTVNSIPNPDNLAGSKVRVASEDRRRKFVRKIGASQG